MTATPGRSLAAQRTHALQARAAVARERLGRPATLAVVAAGDAANQRFVQIKRKAFQDTGLALRPITIPDDATTTSVLHLIDALNRDAEIDAVFLQFPLPAAVDVGRCGDAIMPGKDVDAAGSHNLGRLFAGHARFVPAAPAAVIDLLEDAIGELRGRSIVLVGTAGVVERCIALLAVVRRATVCLLDPDASELMDYAAGADAVVITDALPDPEALRHARSGAVLLDAAYFLPQRPRGWLPERTQAHLGAYIEQYGNVGPLTVTHLMDGTLRAARA